MRIVGIRKELIVVGHVNQPIRINKVKVPKDHVDPADFQVIR